MKLLLLIWIVGLAGCAGNQTVRQPNPSTPTTQPTVSAADHGAVLFRNKGCMSCHVNTRVPGPQTTLVAAGPDSPPNLSEYRHDPAYLRRWLSNPAAVKPTTKMPKLGLSEQEIEDLIAFINAPR